MFSFFKKKPKEPELPPVLDFSFLGTDLHSHLIPGIDDGSPDRDTSLALLSSLHRMGYRKIITTPHVHTEFYDNTIGRIQEHFAILTEHVQASNLDVELGFAAEYFLDNGFLKDVLPHGLLSFGKNYVLVEVSMAGWPRNFDDMIFQVQAQGHTPVLAHPERYLFETNIDTYYKLKERGLLMQMNLLAPTGYYGSGVKALADEYLEAGLYDFVGSDMHHDRHARRVSLIPERQQELMQKLNGYGKFLNGTL